MNATEDRFDLVIVGGGLAGLALAAALRDSRRRIAVIENRAPTRPSGWDPRIYAVSPSSARFLDTLGAWDRLDHGRTCAVESMEVRGDAGGHLRFSAYEAHCAALAWIVEASAMTVELWESVRRQANVTLVSPGQPAALDIGPDVATVRLENGRRLTTRLVVGADGRDSWVRKAAGLQADEHRYGESAVVANFSCDDAHGGTAFQWFRDDGILAWLPLPGRMFSIVWSTPEAHAAELLQMPAEHFAERVAAAGRLRLGRVVPLTAPLAFPLSTVRVPECIGERIALIGDAAHGIHPLSGHGINLGFGDARELARIIGAAAPAEDIGQRPVLRRYQRARREEVCLLQNTTHALHELFADRRIGLSPLRNLGLLMVDRLGPVKSALVRYAMG